MKLLPIKEHLHENHEFAVNPDTSDSLGACVDFYRKIGYHPPWICYYAEKDGNLVGGAAIKGKPVNGRVEIAYVTFPQYQQQGIGTLLANVMVQLSLETDPAVFVTARTLAEENFSTRILRKNNFKLLGTIIDEEDGEVWEWEHKQPKN
jgi:RimJ/RimL family protein N-acetyltransferase